MKRERYSSLVLVEFDAKKVRLVLRFRNETFSPRSGRGYLRPFRTVEFGLKALGPQPHGFFAEAVKKAYAGTVKLHRVGWNAESISLRFSAPGFYPEFTLRSTERSRGDRWDEHRLLADVLGETFFGEKR